MCVFSGNVVQSTCQKKAAKGPAKIAVLAGACSVQLKYIVKTVGIIFQLHVLAGCMFHQV
jgi:hypothetical protein